jgi:D-aminopeptidase
MTNNDRVFWINVEDVYRVVARDEDHAQQLLSEYLEGDCTVPVKHKSGDYQIEEMID